MKQKDDGLQILAPMTGSVRLCIRGITPFIANAPSEKAKHDLLLPRKKTAAERAVTLKHVPVEEYRNSIYRNLGDQAATRIFFPVGGFKKAMMSAALETPGATKSSIARLLWIEGMNVDLFGVPQLVMKLVRSADINRTPDIRSRAILPQWAAKLTVTFIKPKLNDQMVVNLMSGAGLMIGVGDWRQEKGSANFGQFEVVSEEDCADIFNGGGREAQDAALENPAFYDDETLKLMQWWTEEVQNRRQQGFADAQNTRGRKHKVFTDGSSAEVAVNAESADD